MVPAVTEVCLPQPAHSQVHGLVWRPHALVMPQPGQTKPCLPARREEVLGAGCLVRETMLELDKGTREIGHGGSPRAADVRYSFYHAALAGTPMVSPDAEAQGFAPNSFEAGKQDALAFH